MEPLRQDYYNNQTPRDSIEKRLLQAVQLEYVEIKMPDGRNLLAVMTDIPVEKGPGAKYSVTTPR